MDKRTYIIWHRFFLFLDEWGAYITIILLFALYWHANWPIWPFIVAIMWAAFTLTIAYSRQWDMEK